MAKVQKGFALTVAVLGVLSLIFGMGMAICSWILGSKYSNVKIHSDVDDQSFSYDSSSSRSFKSYWWGGLFYCIPGILGIVGGCTRNVVAMVFYLIFNILCLLSSLAVSILMAILIVFWAVINTMLSNGNCVDVFKSGYKACYCKSDLSNDSFMIINASCSDMRSVESILAAIVALASLSSLLAFIASYVSCCSLCNQDQEHGGTVIIQPGVGAYQPPNMYVAQTNTQQFQPPPYAANPNRVPVHDKANLVKNEVI